ncbi:dienelactone hydrolase family protein [Nocardia sp. NPDC004750]
MEFVTPRPVAAVGYRTGGRLASRTAATLGDPRRPDRGRGEFHGGHPADDRPDSPRHHAAGITAQLLVAHADQDGPMPADRIARLEAALAKE